MGMSCSALAQIIDRIEVQSAGDEAEIIVRLTTQVQYVRHTPAVRGDTVLIYFWMNGTDGPAGPGQVQEIKRVPASSMVGEFTVAYPVLDSAIGLRFGNMVNFRVRQGEDGRSFSIFTPLASLPAEIKPQPEVSLPPAPVPQTPEQIEARGQQLLGQAKAAQAQGDLGTAIGALNELLNLPPNPSSMEGQELIGIVREENGELEKARAEYELYLKVYPDSPNAEKIKERLSKLGTETKPKVARAPKRQADKEWSYTGSIMQYYYGGKSQIEIFTPPLPGELTFAKQNLSAVDQSSLVTNLDISARKRTETTDNRIVFREQYTLNFLKDQANKNRPYDAYYEQSSLESGYMARLGRQMGYSGGVMGRFDGVWGGYNLNPEWRVNGVVGMPVEFNSTIKRNFYGVSVDLLPQPEKFTGSTYFIEQHTAGVVDRQAVGVEVRYFDDKKNVFGLLDYDTAFKAVNIAMAQGNMQTSFGSNFFFLADHRKSPMLLITTALQGETQPTIQALLNSGISAEELRRRAALLTADSNVLQVGVTHPLSTKWQIGGDVQVSNVSATQGTAAVPATPASGNRVAYSVQAHGNSVFLENDFAGVNASLINELNRNGYFVSLNHVANLKGQWRIESSLSFYNSKDHLGNVIKQTKPSVRATYDIKQNLSLEAEGGLERRTASGPAENSTSTRSYVYFGYRWLMM